MWIRGIYEVALDNQGGTGISQFYSCYKTGVYSNADCTTAITENKIAIPIKQGYTFLGYYDADGVICIDKNGNLSDYFLGEFTNVTADLTLVAKWQENTYTVDYNSNGGTGSTDSSTHTYDQSKSLTANGFSRVGYMFNCWNTNADGSGTSYADKESVKNLTDVDGETVTLYAKWSVDPYTIGKYVENESIVSDSDGGKPYIVYNDITKTPQSVEPGYIYIIDWSKYTGTVDYIESVTQADGTRYGGGNFNHDINSIDEVYFIGNSSVTFTNMILFHVNYSQYSTVPTIHFKDFNIVDSAFYVWAPEETMHRTMILDIQGECSIKAPTGCKAISGFKKITFEGSGILEVHGGRGACGIDVEDIVNNMTGTLIVYDGNSGKGDDEFIRS